MRPIVSGFNSCTTKLSEFLDSFLKFQAQKCKSFIRDTKDFLRRLNSIKNLPKNSILMTLDVSSLYTNIDQEEGTEACFRNFEERKRKDIPSSVLKNLILLVLRCNIFRFGASLYSQRKGTCMGTPMAPNYANLFMDEFEQNLMNDYHKKTGKRPLIWWRYIDDIFCIWTDGEESLTDFISFIQNYSQHKKLRSKIKFTIHQSSAEVNFLDVCVRINDGKLSTTVYSKSTDSHLYLNTDSNHPRHVVKNIPKSQFMRLRRICSDSGDFLIQSDRYMKYFVNRGYEETKLKSTIREVSQMKRDDLLDDQKKKKDQNRVVFACDWHPSLSQLPQVLKKHFYILQNDTRLKRIFPEVPLVAFRRTKTVRNAVVRSDIAATPSDATRGTVPCSKKCEKTCHLICEGSTITNNKTGRVVKLENACDCNTKDIVYAARCKVCDLIYIGETQDPLRTRFSKHRYDSKKRPDNCELAKHMFDHKHDFEKDLEITVLKQGFKSAQERKYYEDKFVCLLGTLGPNDGMNALSKLGGYAKEMYSMYNDLLGRPEE